MKSMDIREVLFLFCFRICHGFMVKYILGNTYVFYSGLFVMTYEINARQGSDHRKFIDTTLL